MYEGKELDTVGVTACYGRLGMCMKSFDGRRSRLEVTARQGAWSRGWVQCEVELRAMSPCG